MRRLFTASFFIILLTSSMQAQNPLDLEFHRLAVRRFIFSNNLPLSEFVPSQIVSFESMHPAFIPSGTCECDTDFSPKVEKGNLVLDRNSGKTGATFYIGGINPYATYELDIISLKPDSGNSLETGLDLSELGLNNRVQLYASASEHDCGIFYRVIHHGDVEREVRLSENVPDGPFILRIQLYGNTGGFFIEKDGVTSYLGHVAVQDTFPAELDFRNIEVASHSTFNVFSNLEGESTVKGAKSYLSSGVGQADIRLVSYEDLSPCLDEGRLWFTFSCRGLGINQSCQGVMSLDPSLFDPRFEGVIVFDHGDGLLRNDYASHLFYDRKAGEWRAYACDFGGTSFTDGRSGTGLVTATSAKDPRKGFSVMKASRVDVGKVNGHNEDPCIFFDSQAGKWRLLTSVFTDHSIVSGTFESDEWNGSFTPLASPIEMNSTGTSIQRVGDKLYCFMGGNGNLRAHSFPDLKLLGELNLDLQPHWPKPAGRVWASIVPLPEGYPYRYVLLTMDRPNFPGVQGPNWSYGALYYYGAR